MHTERKQSAVNRKTLRYEGVMTAGTAGGAHVPVSVVELMDRKHGTHEAQGLGGDAFRCDFIRSRLSHSHSDERERAKNKEVEDENIATAVRKMRDGRDGGRGEEARRRGNGPEWKIPTAGFYKRQRDGFV